MPRLPLYLRFALLLLLCPTAPAVHAQQQYLPVTDLGTLSGGSYGYSVNNSGQVAGYFDTPPSPYYGTRPFFWSGGVMTDLGTLGGTLSHAYGINSAGQIAGDSSTGTLDAYGRSISHAFLYSGGAMTDIGTLGGSVSIGKGINASGQITGSADTIKPNYYGTHGTHSISVQQRHHD